MIPNSFTKEDTKIIKGSAILWMIAHHVFTYSDRIVDNIVPVSLPIFDNITLAEYIGQFGKICVSLFMFLGGYGIYKSYQETKLDIFSKIKKLYMTYWKVFIVFIPLGFIFFRKQPLYAKDESICQVFSKFDLREMVANFTGISSSYNREWWFFISYLIAIITFPIIVRVIEKVKCYWSLALVVILTIFFQDIAPGLKESIPNLQNSKLYYYFICQTAEVSCFWLGCVMARYDLLNRLKRKMQQICNLNIFTDSMWIFVCIMLRNSILNREFDVIIVPILCIVTLDLVKSVKLDKVFKILGDRSTNMWLIHSFFCYYFYPIAKIVYFPKYAILIFVLEVALSFLAAEGLDMFWKMFYKVRENIKIR